MELGKKIHESDIHDYQAYIDMINKISINEYVVNIVSGDMIFSYNAIDWVTFSHRVNNPNFDRFTSSKYTASSINSGSAIQFEKKSEPKNSSYTLKIPVSEFLFIVNKIKKELEWTNRVNWGI